MFIDILVLDGRNPKSASESTWNQVSLEMFDFVGNLISLWKLPLCFSSFLLLAALSQLQNSKRISIAVK